MTITRSGPRPWPWSGSRQKLEQYQDKNQDQTRKNNKPKTNPRMKSWQRTKPIQDQLHFKPFPEWKTKQKPN